MNKYFHKLLKISFKLNYSKLLDLRIKIEYSNKRKNLNF